LVRLWPRSSPDVFTTCSALPENGRTNKINTQDKRKYLVKIRDLNKPGSKALSCDVVCRVTGGSEILALTRDSRALKRASHSVRSVIIAFSIACLTYSCEYVPCLEICDHACEGVWYKCIVPRTGRTFGSTCQTLPTYSGLLPCTEPWVMLEDAAWLVGMSSSSLSCMLY